MAPKKAQAGPSRFSKLTPDQQKQYLARVHRGISFQPKAAEKKAPVQKIEKKVSKRPVKQLAPKEVAFETTYNLGRTVADIQRLKQAPRAVRNIKRYVRKFLGTSDVRIENDLNKLVWSKGIANVPRKLRLRIVRKNNDKEGKEGKQVVRVTFVPVASFHGLKTRRVDIDETEEVEETTAAQ